MGMFLALHLTGFIYHISQLIRFARVSSHVADFNSETSQTRLSVSQTPLKVFKIILTSL